MATPVEEKEHWKDGSRLVNDSPYSITHEATECFIDEIQEERQKGYGFVPFLGAGFSAPAGAPLITELKTYLQRCVCMALGAEEFDMEAWHPRTDQWPPFIDRKRMEKTRLDPEYWRNRIFESAQNSAQRCLRPGLPPEMQEKIQAEYPVIGEGYGAAAEWRTALQFLSRLEHPSRGSDSPKLPCMELAAQQGEIIDACLREVLKDKYPALSHKMLGVLAGALRLDLVLTTNFDDLLERAFAGARNPLEVFDVQLSGSLPHWSAVSDVRSLIKLHGNRYSLRVDYSLDAPPSESDKKRFLEYLLSGKGRSDSVKPKSPTNLDFHNHLLVMGYSASDRRTIAFIKYAWQHLSEEFRVFWLCYSDRDIAEIEKITREFCESQNDKVHQTRKHSIILRHTDFGLFLLQLYQTIRRNLPPIGGLFPSVSRLTVPPMPSTFVDKQLSVSRGENAFNEGIRYHLNRFKTATDEIYKLVVATSEADERGVTSACSQIYREMEAKNICLWLDMNDISSTDNLFEVLLEAAYFRLGLENWTPLYIASDQRPRRDEILRLVQSVAKPWIIFLNARETPGLNTQRYNADLPNGWLDVRNVRNVRNKKRKTEPDLDSGDPSACLEKFLHLLNELCGKDSQGVSVVLLCRNWKRSPLMEALGKQAQFVKLNEHSKKIDGFSEEKVTARAIEWTATDIDKQRFLHALVLMQRPRLLATIWSSAVSLSNNQSAATLKKRQKWVQELEDRGLLRRKAGGFIWIHSRCRESIREVLGNRQKRDKFFDEFKEAKDAWGNWDPTTDEPRIHSRLAGWYEKVLDASESPASVFEAVYHLCRAAQTYLELDNPKTDRACRRVEAASALLKANSSLIQTFGYSRGSCRHLEYIRDTLCKSISDKLKSAPDEWSNELSDSIKRLRIVCTEVMRVIAREVGEDREMYLRHRQLGTLLAGRELKKPCEKISREIHGKLFACKTPSAADTLRHHERGKYISDPAVEWLRWCRWSGMLGIATRSFPVARRALEKALLFVTQDDLAYPDSGGAIDWERLERGELKIFGDQDKSRLQELQIEVLQIIEQYVWLMILEYGVANRLTALSKPRAQAGLREEALKHVKNIETHINHGRKLVLQIRGKDHSSDSHIGIRANWCEGRLLMHMSVCASSRVQLNFGDEKAVLQNAMALLGDAEAGLRVSDPRRNRPELAMIELHRADARLHQAESVPIRNVKKDSHEPSPMSFGEMCRILEARVLEQGWDKQGQDVRNEIRGKGDKWGSDVDRGLRRAKSLVTDSIRFLNRAEPVLRARRRNVWWTTWFFERRLRAIGLSVWASVFEIDTPIPFLGLEAAMRKTDTEADTLLEDAIRMIRVDAYRLASIVDAYASCVKALQTRLVLHTSVPLKERQKAMHASLGNALKALGEVEKRRNRVAKKWKRNGGMDAKIKRYVKEVKQRTEKIAKQLGQSA